MGFIINPYAFGAAYDADAQAFFTAAGITDNTQKTAVNQLVVDLKTYGIWTKMKALYPFVGGTATTHKYNLKDPQDTDAAFRLVFNGGWTHSSTGVLPNGTNGYADTKLQPSTILSLNNTHLSVYSRTSAIQSGVEIGSSNVGDINFLWLATRRSGNYNFWMNQSSVTTPASSDGSGFFIGNRTASNIKNGWRNGVKVENVTTASDALPIKTTYIGAAQYANITAFYSSREQSFASIGDGLDDTEAANYYTAVQTFQTTLGRNV